MCSAGYSITCVIVVVASLSTSPPSNSSPPPLSSPNLTSFNFVSPLIPDLPASGKVNTLSFRPLSITFFRALIPTQSTSCFIASRSDTVLRMTVLRRTVLPRGNVCGVALGRRGVSNVCVGYGVDCTGRARVRTFGVATAWSGSGSGSWNASTSGPHENPIKAPAPLSRGVDRPNRWDGVECSAEMPGEEEAPDDWKSAEKANAWDRSPSSS